MILTLLMLACVEEPEPVDVGDTPELPEPPDTSHLDMPGAYEEMLAIGLSVDMRAAWAGHVAALELGEPGCPDLYVGFPDPEMNGPDGGLSWSDRCITRAGRTFSGFAWWEDEIAAAEDEVEGLTIDARRAIEADGVLAQGAEALFEFDGEGSDSVRRVEDGDYLSWGYSSLIDATVTGSLPFGDGAQAGGWRAELSLDYSAGAAQRLTAQGNVYFFDAKVQDHFDSLQIDLEMVGPDSAGPDDCTLEPRGYIGLRDSEAFWYDLVFLPRYDDPDEDPYPNDPYSACDGCGTLYIRGVQQEEPICVDLSWVWDTLSPPDPADFVLSTRDLGEED